MALKANNIATYWQYYYYLLLRQSDRIEFDIQSAEKIIFYYVKLL